MECAAAPGEYALLCVGCPRASACTYAVEPVSQPAQTGLHEEGAAPAEEKHEVPADEQCESLGKDAEKEPIQTRQTGLQRAKRLQPRSYSEEGKGGCSCQTAWWCRQSRANRSPRAIPCLQGKNRENPANRAQKQGGSGRVTGIPHRNPPLLQALTPAPDALSCSSTEQGSSTPRTGKVVTRTGSRAVARHGSHCTAL